MVTSGSATSVWQRLWPSTICKFWGLHAFVWSVAAAALAASMRAVWPLPYAVSNLLLARFLYLTREDVRRSLGLGSCAFFTAHAALLWFAPLSSWIGRVVLCLQLLRVWHAVLAAGSFAFAVKASLKDRLFAEDGSMRRGARLDPALAIPTLALINRGAGAKIGATVGQLLDDAASGAGGDGATVLRMVDLSDTSPSEALLAFGKEHGAFRVLVCGGDGTVSWVLGAVETCGLTGWDGKPYRPAVAVLPLGTGNDLARVLGWGKGVQLDALPSRLEALDEARVAMLDRWAVRGTLPEGTSHVQMFNYLSLGVDAKAALLWARFAKRCPQLFKLRLLNKLWYIVCGTPAFLLHSYRDLTERVRLVCDGEVIEIPRGIEGLMILNTPSYGGGSDLWDESRGAPLSSRTRHFQTSPTLPSSMADGVLEVVGVTDVVHLALSLGGLSNGVRLCQGRSISLTAPVAGVPLQIDGEPFQKSTGEDSEPFDLTIALDGRATMLARGGPGASSAFGAVEGQLRSKAISTPQRDALLEALS